MTHSSANDIAALPRHKLTTLDNGLVIRRRTTLLQFGAVVELQP